MLYRVGLAINGVRTHNFSGDRQSIVQVVVNDDDDVPCKHVIHFFIVLSKLFYVIGFLGFPIVYTLWMSTKRRCMHNVLPTGNFVISKRNLDIIMLFVCLSVWWCLAPLSTIFQLMVLLVEETRGPAENHRHVRNHRQTLSHTVVSSTPRLNGIRTHNVSGDRYWLNRLLLHYITWRYYTQ
jgi:hypothetical protein